ncbi:MAG: hypothetical protein ACRD4O_05520, partial [Bryobacteraceae bacterium]
MNFTPLAPVRSCSRTYTSTSSSAVVFRPEPDRYTGIGAPEFLAAQLVVGVRHVDLVEEMFEVSRILTEKVGPHAARQDRNVIHYVFGLDEPFGAVAGAGAQEVSIMSVQQID